jgi:DNA-binding CsgD family transcriptional regulator
MIEREEKTVPTLQIRRASPRLPKWNDAEPAKSQLSQPQPIESTHAQRDPDATIALELVRQRSAPSMFILGRDDTVLYSNEKTLSIFKDPQHLPAEVLDFCRRIRNRALDAPFDCSGMDCAIFRGPEGDLYSFRGFLVQGQESSPSHVMVLVDKVVNRSPINLEKARRQFGLSDREIEVVILVAQGLCNKEIGAKLYVSEHTVKGHLKNVTRKVGAESRGNIIAILK